MIDTVCYCELQLLRNDYVLIYFEGNRVLSHDEQSSLLEQINNKEPTLTATIFTVLSYCTLSPKSLGVAFEAYMEEEKLWSYLYNMTGIQFINYCLKSVVKPCQL